MGPVKQLFTAAEMASNGNVTNDCTQLPLLKKVIVTYAVAGGVGMLVACVILIVLLYTRVSKTILQRLIIYSFFAVIV